MISLECNGTGDTYFFLRISIRRNENIAFISLMKECFGDEGIEPVGGFHT